MVKGGIPTCPLFLDSVALLQLQGSLFRFSGIPRNTCNLTAIIKSVKVCQKVYFIRTKLRAYITEMEKPFIVLI